MCLSIFWHHSIILRLKLFINIKFFLLWFQQLKLNKEKKKLHNDVFVRIFKNNEEVFFSRNLSGSKSANLWRLKIFLKFLTHKFYNAKKYSSEELYNKVLQKFSISQFLLFKNITTFSVPRAHFAAYFKKVSSNSTNSASQDYG